MNTILYPICPTCKYPISILKIYVDFNSDLLIQFNCKCKYRKRTLYFHEYFSELLYYSACHKEHYLIDFPKIRYCFKCNKLLDEYNIEIHLNHTLMYQKNKRLFQICKFHSKKITHFCVECSKGLCDYYRKTIHSSHSIITINDFYNEIKQKIEIFQNDREKFMKKIFVNHKKYMNLKSIDSLNLLYKLYFDCFNSKIGFSDTTLMNNLKILLDIKEISFYPFLIKKPFLNKQLRTYGYFPNISNLIRPFDKNLLSFIYLITILNNDKIAIEYIAPGKHEELMWKKRCIVQIYDKTLINLEKEIEIYGIAEKIFSVYYDNVFLVFGDHMELWDIKGPKMIKSYGEPNEPMSYYDSLRNNPSTVTLFDPKTIFYKYKRNYLCLDLEKDKVIEFKKFYSLSPLKVEKMNNRNIIMICSTFIDIVDWYKKKQIGCLDKYSSKLYLYDYPFIFYPKKYIITAAEEVKTSNFYLECWDEVTLQRKYFTKFFTTIGDIHKLSQKEILISSEFYKFFCRFNVDIGQVTQIFKFFDHPKTPKGFSIFNDTLFILEEQVIYCEKIPTLR